MKVVMLVIFSVIAVVVLAVLWAGSQKGSTALVEVGEVFVDGSKSAVLDNPIPESLQVMVWNIGYGRGAEGDYAGPWSPDLFERNLEGIAEVIRTAKTDVALLQEVDLGASRSHYVHQGRAIAEKLGWAYCACVTTWSNRYVPFPYWPPAKHYGPMLSGQCVISRYPIETNVRYRQPQPADNPFWYNMFYLHRALQQVEVQVPGMGLIPMLNVHLEAFDVDNNRIHAQNLLHLMDQSESPALVVGGDFNALPIGAQKKVGYEDEPDIDFTGGNTMELFFEAGRMVDAISSSERAEAHTFPADAPTRRLDYLTADKRGWRISGEVILGNTARLSDHLPIKATLSPLKLAGEGAPPQGEGLPGREQGRAGE